MTHLSKEQKTQMLTQIKLFQDQRDKIAKSIRPLTDQMRELADEIEQVYEKFGVDEPYFYCVGCQTPLFDGDQVQGYADGEKACEECACTWDEIKNLVETDPDSFEDPEPTRALIASHVKNGGSMDAKFTSPL